MQNDELARILVAELTRIVRQLEACDSLYVNSTWERMVETSIELTRFGETPTSHSETFK